MPLVIRTRIRQTGFAGDITLERELREGDFESLRAVLNRNADVCSKHLADIGCCNFVEHEIKIKVGAIPHREGAR